MRKIALLLVIGQAALVATLAIGLRRRWFPLGVPQEWEWLRINAAPEPISLLFGIGGVIVFAAIAAAGFRSLSLRGGARREGLWVAILALSSILVQALVQDAAPQPYGLSKWIIALHAPGSSGYYTVARNQMARPGEFLANYPGWIAHQDALHVGTHPPGLFVTAKLMLVLTESNPELCRWVVKFAPATVSHAITAFRESVKLPRADAVALTLTGALTLVVCGLTVIPLYLLARSVLPASSAWVSACLWPLVPSALMFQPAADAAFPFLSTAALALTCWAGRGGSRVGYLLGLGSGLVMALGMFFTLAFLPVGLIVALVILSDSEITWTRKMVLLLSTGIGFVMGTMGWWWATSANPLAIWWVNQQNHGRFYVEYPRNYLAWVIENPIELAVALGLPSVVWILAGLTSFRQVPRVVWATLFVLCFLTISGKNLSEVARLWLPLMPPLLLAAGTAFTRANGRAWHLAATIGLVAIQVLILEATIQVVYPI